MYNANVLCLYYLSRSIYDSTYSSLSHFPLRIPRLATQPRITQPTTLPSQFKNAIAILVSCTAGSYSPSCATRAGCSRRPLPPPLGYFTIRYILRKEVYFLAEQAYLQPSGLFNVGYRFGRHRASFSYFLTRTCTIADAGCRTMFLHLQSQDPQVYSPRFQLARGFKPRLLRAYLMPLFFYFYLKQIQ